MVVTMDFNALVDIPAVDALQFTLHFFQFVHYLVAGIITQLQYQMVIAGGELALCPETFGNYVEYRAGGVVGNRLF